MTFFCSVARKVHAASFVVEQVMFLGYTVSHIWFRIKFFGEWRGGSGV
jgi:hypothetical protein